MLKRLFFSVAAVAVWAGCATTGGWPNNLQSRAAFDLSCPAEELKLTPLEKIPQCFGGPCIQTAGIQGCGKKATYVWLSKSEQWVLNSGSQEAK